MFTRLIQRKPFATLIARVSVSGILQSTPLITLPSSTLSPSSATVLYGRWSRSTSGDRTFPPTAASVSNSLPESVRSSPSLQVFRSWLKIELFARLTAVVSLTKNVSLQWLLPCVCILCSLRPKGLSLWHVKVHSFTIIAIIIVLCSRSGVGLTRVLNNLWYRKSFAPKNSANTIAVEGGLRCTHAVSALLRRRHRRNHSLYSSLVRR